MATPGSPEQRPEETTSLPGFVRILSADVGAKADVAAELRHAHAAADRRGERSPAGSSLRGGLMVVVLIAVVLVLAALTVLIGWKVTA